MLCALSTLLAGVVLVIVSNSAGDAEPTGDRPSHAHAGADRDDLPTVATLSDPVALGTGSAQLELRSARGKDGAVLAGEPVVLRVHMLGTTDGGNVSVTAQRDARPGAPGENAELEHDATVAVDTKAGQVYVLSGNLGHEHDHTGSALASVAGSATEWATGFTPGSSLAFSDDGRWLAAAHREHGIIDVIDVMLHEVRAVPIPSPARAIRFAPGRDTLWVADSDRTVTTVDPTTGATQSVGTVPQRPSALAVADDGTTALVSQGGGATLLRSGDGPASTAVRAGALRNAVWVPSLREFVGIDPNGAILGVGADGIRRTIHPSAGSADATLLTVDTGRTRALVVDRAAARSAVVDLASGAVLGVAQTGPRPAQVALLEEFAIVRDAQTPTLTWVNLAQPDRSADIDLGTAIPASISARPGASELLATLPEDKKVLRVHTMMGRPMVMSTDPTGLTADTAAVTSTRFTRAGDGAWEIATVLPANGTYRVTVTSDRGVASFPVEVTGAGAPATITSAPVRVEGRVGEPIPITVVLQGATPATLGLVAAEVRGTAQRQLVARRNADTGTYRTTFVARHAGEYQIFAVPAGDAPITATVVATAFIR